MLLKRFTFGIVLSCWLGGCAIHPLPENVTGVKTAGIVHRIRCEARSAVLDAKEALNRKLQRAQQQGSRNRLRTLQAKLKILEDVGIVYTGLRQGEKLNEVLFNDDEFGRCLHHPLISPST